MWYCISGHDYLRDRKKRFRCKDCGTKIGKFEDCPTCKKAKKLLSLPDLREEYKDELETEEDRLIRAMEAQQQKHKEEKRGTFFADWDAVISNQTKRKNTEGEIQYRQVGSRDLYAQIPTETLYKGPTKHCDVCGTTKGMLLEQWYDTPESDELDDKMEEMGCYDSNNAPYVLLCRSCEEDFFTESNIINSMKLEEIDHLNPQDYMLPSNVAVDEYMDWAVINKLMMRKNPLLVEQWNQHKDVLIHGFMPGKINHLPNNRKWVSDENKEIDKKLHSLSSAMGSKLT